MEQPYSTINVERRLPIMLLELLHILLGLFKEMEIRVPKRKRKKVKGKIAN